MGFGDWPLTAAVGDVIATAQKSVPAQASCLVHRGLPYWQIQLQIDDPDWAHLVAHFLPSIANPGSALAPQAWCTETVAFWHREAQVPWGAGYSTVWWPSSYVQSAKELRLWYQFEEDPSGIFGFFGYEGRGRWINGSELDYANFTPGINAPCPGAYQCWEAFNSTTGAWEDSCFHSQVVDSMVVYRFGAADGPVFRVDVFVVEGNASGGNFVDINGTSVSRGKVRTDRSYPDVIDYTSLGDQGLACGLTFRRIRGWGIDLDAAGNPMCDESRITTIVQLLIAGYPAPTSSPDPDITMVNRLITYFQQSNGASKAVTTNAAAIHTGGALPSPTNHWTIPQGPLMVDPSYIQVDLLAEHPIPLRGLVVDWKDGIVPIQYQAWWAGQDGQIHTTVVNLTPGEPPPSGSQSVPIPATFGPAPSYLVRYMRLVFSNPYLTRAFEITGLHFLFDYGRDDDNGSVLEEEPPVVGVPRLVPEAEGFRLIAVRPNPVGRAATIEFELSGPGPAQLRIFDVTGKRVRQFALAALDRGPRQLVWDGCDEAGQRVRSGSYFVELRSGGTRARGKLIVMR